ncbi:response regulator transcription factor [Candidatus Laterigemmans baculatus]|uniref:response regulator transcription factor n=1 Tax=Candidatus Laterigemmans baculatus TaxID=2770505 RepID=UPI00193FAF23|nr:response regulator transcription factor [Candidatus Laterigemmans baculatus]
MRAMYERGDSIKEIAETLERSDSAVKTRVSLCGMSREWKPRKDRAELLARATQLGLISALLGLTDGQLETLLAVVEAGAGDTALLESVLQTSRDMVNKHLRVLEQRELIAIAPFDNPRIVVPRLSIFSAAMEPPIPAPLPGRAEPSNAVAELLALRRPLIERIFRQFCAKQQIFAVLERHIKQAQQADWKSRDFVLQVLS